MTFSINPEDRRPLYLQIIDEVRRARLLGLVAPAEPLPSVRQLAVDLRINPNTVAQAYRELERQGVVQMRRGQGTFLTATDGAAASEDRALLVQAVARRAVSDAIRNGLTIESLIEALRQANKASLPTTPHESRD